MYRPRILDTSFALGAAMRANGMLVVARKIIADGPVIRRVPNKGVQQL